MEEEVKPVETKSSKKKKGKNNKQAAPEAPTAQVNTPSQPSKPEDEETKKPDAASDNTDFDAKIAAMERENKDVMAKKEQEVNKL